MLPQIHAYMNTNTQYHKRITLHNIALHPPPSHYITQHYVALINTHIHAYKPTYLHTCTYITQPTSMTLQHITLHTYIRACRHA